VANGFVCLFLALAIKGLKTMYSNKIKAKAKGTVNHNKGFSEVSSQPVISSKPI
jgi:hypothetical protein